MDETSRRVGGCKDWVEDRGEVQGVNGRGERRCDYRAGLGDSRLVVLSERAMYIVRDSSAKWQKKATGTYPLFTPSI